jgi:hypothetical protein
MRIAKLCQNSGGKKGGFGREPFRKNMDIQLFCINIFMSSISL